MPKFELSQQIIATCNEFGGSHETGVTLEPIVAESHEAAVEKFSNTQPGPTYISGRNKNLVFPGMKWEEVPLDDYRGVFWLIRPEPCPESWAGSCLDWEKKQIIEGSSESSPHALSRTQSR